MLLLVEVLAESRTRRTACLESALIHLHPFPLLQGAGNNRHITKQVEPEETGGPEEPAIHTDLLLVVTPFHSSRAARRAERRIYDKTCNIM